MPGHEKTPALTHKQVGVAGCGLMGAGIAEVLARAGHEVLVYDVSDQALTSGRARLTASLQTAVDRGKLAPEAREDAWSRLQFTTDLDTFARCEIVIEAAPEAADLKRRLFGRLGQICRPDALLASNTSSVPLVALASATVHPERVLGLHFFNPAPIMPLVELVQPLTAQKLAIERARAFVETLGKQAVLVRDRPGFLVNALLLPYLLDAIRLFEQGVATREDLDTSMKLGCGHPMGPLELADLIGLDTVLAIADVLYEELREAKYAAPPLLRQMVRAGHLGRKAALGFYPYPREGSS